MRERRKNSRVSLPLCVEVRRDRWEEHISQDIARRGIYVRMVGSCPVGQLMQLKVHLPGETASLEMMARVARRVPAWTALGKAQLPGVGFEFFCLSENVIAQWDAFIARALDLSEALPGLSPEALYRRLEVNESSTVPLRPHEERRHEAATFIPAQPSRAQLIFRPRNREALERFVQDNLLEGRFGLSIPYKMKTGAEVGLRIIHPSTLEEQLLLGDLETSEGRENYVIHLQKPDEFQLEAFLMFVDTGRPPEPLAQVA